MVQLKANISATDFVNALSRLKDYIGNDELRPAMTGIFCYGEDKNLVLVATNAHMLKEIVFKNVLAEKAPQDASFIIPQPIVLEVIKTPLSKKEGIDFMIEKKKVNIKGDTLNQSFVPIDGDYPTYRMVIPQEQPYHISFSKKDMLQSFEQIRPFTNKTTNQIIFQTASKPSELVLGAFDIFFKLSGIERVKAEFNEALKIGFNIQFFTSVLKSLHSDKVKININSATQAITLYEKTDKTEELSLLMPIMLGDEEWIQGDIALNASTVDYCEGDCPYVGSFTIKGETLAQEWQLIKSFMDKKPQVAILYSILLKVKGKKLTIIATDLENFLVKELPLISSTGDFIGTLPVDILGDFFKTTKDSVLTFKVHTPSPESRKYGKIIINALSGEYTFATDNAHDFPELPTENNETDSLFSIDSPIFKTLLERAIPAVSTDELRPAMTGVLLEGANNILHVVATDAHILTESITFSDKIPDMSLILNIKGAKSLVRHLASISDEKVSVSTIKNISLVFQTEDTTIISRIVDARYPNYESVMPEGYSRYVTIPTTPLKKILTDYFKKYKKDVPILFVLKEKALFTQQLIIKEYANNKPIYAKQGELTSLQAVIEEGENIEIAVSPELMLKLLGSMNEKVRMTFCSPTRAILLENIQEDMPIKTRNLLMPALYDAAEWIKENCDTQYPKFDIKQGNYKAPAPKKVKKEVYKIVDTPSVSDDIWTVEIPIQWDFSWLNPPKRGESYSEKEWDNIVATIKEMRSAKDNPSRDFKELIEHAQKLEDYIIAQTGKTRQELKGSSFLFNMPVNRLTNASGILSELYEGFKDNANGRAVWRLAELPNPYEVKKLRTEDLIRDYFLYVSKLAYHHYQYHIDKIRLNKYWETPNKDFSELEAVDSTNPYKRDTITIPEDEKRDISKIIEIALNLPTDPTIYAGFFEHLKRVEGITSEKVRNKHYDTLKFYAKAIPVNSTGRIYQKYILKKEYYNTFPDLAELSQKRLSEAIEKLKQREVRFFSPEALEIVNTPLVNTPSVSEPKKTKIVPSSKFIFEAHQIVGTKYAGGISAKEDKLKKLFSDNNYEYSRDTVKEILYNDYKAKGGTKSLDEYTEWFFDETKSAEYKAALKVVNALKNGQWEYAMTEERLLGGMMKMIQESEYEWKNLTEKNIKNIFDLFIEGKGYFFMRNEDTYGFKGKHSSFIIRKITTPSVSERKIQYVIELKKGKRIDKDWWDSASELERNYGMDYIQGEYATIQELKENIQAIRRIATKNNILIQDIQKRGGDALVVINSKDYLLRYYDNGEYNLVSINDLKDRYSDKKAREKEPQTLSTIENNDKEKLEKRIALLKRTLKFQKGEDKEKLEKRIKTLERALKYQ